MRKKSFCLIKLDRDFTLKVFSLEQKMMLANEETLEKYILFNKMRIKKNAKSCSLFVRTDNKNKSTCVFPKLSETRINIVILHYYIVSFRQKYRKMKAKGKNFKANKRQKRADLECKPVSNKKETFPCQIIVLNWLLSRTYNIKKQKHSNLLPASTNEFDE